MNGKPPSPVHNAARPSAALSFHSVTTGVDRSERRDDERVRAGASITPTPKERAAGNEQERPGALHPRDDAAERAGHERHGPQVRQVEPRLHDEDRRQQEQHRPGQHPTRPRPPGEEPRNTTTTLIAITRRDPLVAEQMGRRDRRGPTRLVLREEAAAALAEEPQGRELGIINAGREGHVPLRQRPRLVHVHRLVGVAAHQRSQVGARNERDHAGRGHHSEQAEPRPSPARHAVGRHTAQPRLARSAPSSWVIQAYSAWSSKLGSAGSTCRGPTRG